MMNVESKISVLIVDSKPKSKLKSFEELSKRDFDVVGTANDGHNTLKLIYEYQPDIVILDLVISGIDSISVLRTIATSYIEKKPSFIITSIIFTEFALRESAKWGASFFVLKPFDYETLALRIRGIYYDSLNNSTGIHLRDRIYCGKVSSPYYPVINSSNKIDDIAAKLLLDIGVPTHCKGFQFIRMSIIMVSVDDTIINKITCVMYPAIAKKFSTTVANVERNIRYCKKIVFGRINADNKKNFFGEFLSRSSIIPSNSEFIAILSEELKNKCS